MKVEVIRKKIVPAELRLTGNECYIEMFKEVRHMLAEYDDNTLLNFEDKTTQKNYEFRIFRRVKDSKVTQVWLKTLTEYKNDKDIQPFDELIIEKVSDGEKEAKFYIDVEKFNSRFELTYSKEKEKFQLQKPLKEKFDDLINNKDINILLGDGNIINLDIKKEEELYTIDNIGDVMIDYDFSPIILQSKYKNFYEIFKSVKSSYKIIQY